MGIDSRSRLRGFVTNDFSSNYVAGAGSFEQGRREVLAFTKLSPFVAKKNPFLARNYAKRCEILRANLRGSITRQAAIVELSRGG